MKYLALINIIFMLTITSCEFENEVNITKHTINGKIINVNNPTQFVGKKLYLESQYSSLFEGTIIETIAETIVTDSSSFEFIYESSPGTSLYIKCYELPNFLRSVSVNQNITPTFYISDSATLVLNLYSDNLLKTNDTLYLKYIRPSVNKPDTFLLIGPITNNYKLPFRGYNYGGYNFSWGVGYNDFRANGNRRHKNFALTGDPFIDTVELKY